MRARLFYVFVVGRPVYIISNISLQLRIDEWLFFSLFLVVVSSR